MLVFRRCLLVLLMLRFVPGCGSSDPTGTPSREPLSPSASGQPLAEAPDRQAEAPEPKSPSTSDGSLFSDLPDQDDPPNAGTVMEDPNLKDVAPASDPTSQELPPETQWETWCESLMSGTPEARRQAAEGIAQTLRPFSSEDLAALLAHDSAFVRRGVAFDLLERFNPNDDQIAAAFIRSLADQDATVRHIALTAVRRLPHDKLVTALEPLTSLMISPAESSANRIAVIRLIASMQSQAQDALPLLHELLRTDADSAVRSASAVAIARVADPPQAVQWLQGALAGEPDPAVRTVFVVRLGRIGTPAAAALDELSETLRTEDAELQRAVIDAMIAIGKPSVPHLILLLDASDVAIRRLAVFALGNLGPTAADAAEALQARLQDQDGEVRQLAEIALARIASSR
ncbi:MAG: hypothetical protein EA424_10215 [Planctomycetaceae bacterium]|nr:MAG: hypothetical protein EA424_10215 [Planctomycetaceae bacterium]